MMVMIEDVPLKETTTPETHGLCLKTESWLFGTL